MISNCFITIDQPLKSGAKVTRISVPEFEKIRDPSRIFRLAARIGYRVERAFGGTFAVTGKEVPDILVYQPASNIQELRLNFIDGSFTAIPDGQIDLNPSVSLHCAVLERIMSRVLEKSFKQLGYEEYGGTLRRPQYKLVFTQDNSPVRFYLDAFRYSVQVFSDGRLAIWIDLKASWDQPAKEFIDHKLGQGLSEEEVRKIMLEKKMNVALEPGHGEGVLTDLIFHRTADTFILKDDPKRRTLAEYWREEYHRFIPKDDFVIMAKKVGSYRDLAYPASVVHLMVRGESIPSRFMRLLQKPSKERLERIQELVRQINLRSLSLNGNRILFDEKPVDWQNMVHQGKFISVGSREDILLKMTPEHSSVDSRDIMKFGPYSGPKKINIALAIPSGFKDLCHPFIAVLKKYFESFKMGEINLMDVFEIQKLTPMSYWEKGYEIGRYFDMKKDKNKICLVVLPERGGVGTEYFEFRRGIGRAKELSSKAVQTLLPDTVKDVINEKDRNLIGNILVQLYLKTLDRGEAVWLLNKPAGDSYNTCYMGYDVSRISERIFDPTAKTWIREKKEAAAYAAVCDSYGRVIECRSLYAQRGEMLTPDDVLRLLYETLHECKTAMKEYYNEDFNRLVVYRDGSIKTTDLRMMELGIQKTFDAIRDKYSSLTVDVVAVIKTGIERIFDNDGTNPIIGQYVVLDDYNALLCTSDMKNRSEYVSAKPIKLNYALSKSLDGQNHRSKMEKVAHEFIDLTKLYWVSLVHSPKLALPLILVQQIGKFTIRDVSVPKDVPYIPL